MTILCALKHGRPAHDVRESTVTQPGNQLLSRLPAASRSRLESLGQVVELRLAETVGAARGPTDAVLFPLDGFISLLAQVDGGHATEVGRVGRDGMLGIQLALGVVAEPLSAVVLGPGQARRLGAAPFRRELLADAALRATIHRYV